MHLTLVHLYPTRMNLYGDRGNVIALRRRAEWRGWSVDVRLVEVGDPIPWDDTDCLFIGGGEDKHQTMIAEDFLARGDKVLEAAQAGLPVLAICGGYQLLGHDYETADGRTLPGLGWFDVHTRAGKVRSIGNVVVETRLGLTPNTLVGFENHGGQTFLEAGQEPLGRVLAGHGNNGQDHTEGAVKLRSIGTYLHGSLLPKNPHLTDWLLAQVLERKTGVQHLAALNDAEEMEAHGDLMRRTMRQA